MLDYLTSFFLFAQEAAVSAPAAAPAGGDAPTSSGGGMEMLLFMLLPLLVFYWFFMMRPQQKQEERQRKMMEELDRNVRVMTVGGMIGTIHSIDREKNEVVLKVDDSNGTKIHFLLSAITGPLPKDSEKTT